MCDISVHTERQHYTVYIGNAIAYYPIDGFLVFEGYTSLKNEDLPVNAFIHCVYNKTHINSFVDVEITNVWRKDLQDKPLTKEEIERNKCSCGPDDDCECNIVFFPTYLVILEFKPIKREADFPNCDMIGKDEWNYCIDNRFSSPQELLSAYKALVDLPEGSSFTNEHREEDVGFYLGYYNETEKDINKHTLSDERMGELKDSLMAFEALKARRRVERELKEKEKMEEMLKRMNSGDSSNKILLPKQLVGINTVGYSLRKIMSTIQSAPDE